eukprot:TRINITY_DN474_c0_g1_i1.p1 TRINITY_DN474_c0_g1~~TRINITY_DN474_c0_g1_i1.p1  ORF type:complete len:259 (+),score=33.21 TRINITY_DN474_c0_g1_i1:275-1051(+)
MIGQPGTPYYGGVYALNLTLPRDYPFKPPKVSFATQVLSPRVTQSGVICCCQADVLKDQWSPALSASKLMVMLCNLFTGKDAEFMQGSYERGCSVPSVLRDLGNDALFAKLTSFTRSDCSRFDRSFLQDAHTWSVQELTDAGLSRTASNEAEAARIRTTLPSWMRCYHALSELPFNVIPPMIFQVLQQLRTPWLPDVHSVFAYWLGEGFAMQVKTLLLCSAIVQDGSGMPRYPQAAIAMLPAELLQVLIQHLAAQWWG